MGIVVGEVLWVKYWLIRSSSKRKVAVPTTDNSETRLNENKIKSVALLKNWTTLEYCLSLTVSYDGSGVWTELLTLLPTHNQ